MSKDKEIINDGTPLNGHNDPLAGVDGLLD